MPSVTFFFHKEDYWEPAITIQHDRSFSQRKKLRGRAVVQLMPHPGGPTWPQLVCASTLASIAVKRNPAVEIIFKPATSLWTYHHQLPLTEEIWKHDTPQPIHDVARPPG
ncbi:hypothetical protein [Bradyrhizobium stylosanthis]|uniref:Uncharacterized protein n=1 Tax=Bradyrhizobium stylosanthis TaxID=1803665 RepID=A0A560DKA4_9BRAD|nr:hypothetical protein [Bradyrhizobium stylosanthis]TWA97541.1 hypothetical protein FBZ96_106600 [Bradyrhizobium stylosanthis]